MLCGSHAESYSEAESWTDIAGVEISCGELWGIGTDGSLQRTGSGPRAHIDDFTDIQELALDGSHMVALKKDGSMIAFSDDNSEYPNLDYMAGKKNKPE